jgi:hypothetical protein
MNQGFSGKNHEITTLLLNPRILRFSEQSVEKA